MRDSKGESPFSDWLLGLKDKVAQIKIHARIDRASLGNFGDWKEVKGTKRLYEMREHYGPGYRIFYTIVNNKQVLLLAGSTKKDQSRVVQTAIEYLADYESAGGHD
ncbi:MAG: type II toxin-antitoxin system RelE/ParE family toxin [bacterium]|nr:type II toxin-antitoxin system RelE/ParE family toxin [bacterium]